MSTHSSFTNRFAFPSAAEVFRSAQRLALAPLVNVETQVRLSELAGELALPVQTVCYECRLKADDDRVDLALCILPPYVDQDRFAASLDELARSHADEPEWLRTLEFLRAWAAMAPGYRPEFPFVWLAFDLDKQMRALPVPCPAPCVDADFFARRLGVTPNPTPPSRMATLANTCHEAFFCSSMPEDVRQRFIRCLSVEGVNVHAKHFSFMLPRQPPTFKLDVQLPVDQVAAFLGGIEWPGPAAEIEARIRHFMSWDGLVQLNLVLSPQLTGPLEVEFMSGGQAIAPANRFAFLDRMVGAGLCSTGKGRILRETWQQRLLPAADACESDIALNWYVKIRFEEDVATEAKAYVGLMPRLWRGAKEPVSLAVTAP